MISPSSSYPLVTSWNILSAVSFFFTPRKGATGRFQPLLLGLGFFCNCSFERFERKRNPVLQDRSFIFCSYWLCYAVLALE